MECWLILQRNFIDNNRVGRAGCLALFNHGIMEYGNGGMMGLDKERI